jgi:hypothetical protein
MVCLPPPELNPVAGDHITPISTGSRNVVTYLWSPRRSLPAKIRWSG